MAAVPLTLIRLNARCNLQDCIFRFSKIFLLYFILINYANLCKIGTRIDLDVSYKNA